MHKKTIWLFCAGFLIVAWTAWLSGWFRTTGNTPASDVSRQIRYSFTLENRSARLKENVVLWVYAPVETTATQRCGRIAASHPYKRLSDACGNQILRFTFADMAPYASTIVSLKINLRISDNPAPVEDGRSINRFLEPEPFVESDHPVIADRAKTLKKTNKPATAASIFQWVSAHVQYSGYSGPEQGAWHAYTHQTGDCTEYMDLFTALCRAAAIPCRRMGGYICPKNKVLKGSGYHNWAEFYLDGKWHIADPQNRRFMEQPGDYIAMNIISSSCPNEMGHHQRFRVKGQEITVKMNS